MKDISWKHVTIVVSFFAVVGVLSGTGHDTGAFIAVGLGVLGSLGIIVAQVTSTQEAARATHQQSNGNLSKMMAIIEKQGALLAAMQPPATPPTDLAAAPTLEAGPMGFQADLAQRDTTAPGMRVAATSR